MDLWKAVLIKKGVPSIPHSVLDIQISVILSWTPKHISTHVYTHPQHTCFHPPLQLIDLFVLVILLVFHFPKDLQQAVHLSLGLPRILFVAGHFLLKSLNTLGQLGVGLSLEGCILSLTEIKMLVRKQLFSLRCQQVGIRKLKSGTLCHNKSNFSI